MIRCIQIGGKDGPILQGELLRKWSEPRRYAPDWAPQSEQRATIALDGRTVSGRLIEHSQRDGALPVASLTSPGGLSSAHREAF